MGKRSCFDWRRAHQKLGYRKQRRKQTAAEARPGAQQMDGKHRGTGSASAAREVQRGKEKRRKRVNFAEKEREGERESDAGQRKQWERK